MVDVITSIDIKAPISRVTAYAMEQDHAPEWYVNIESVEWRTARPMTVGSRFAFIAHFLGRKLSYVYEVVKLSDRELVMRTADGPFPMETTYLFEKLDDGLTKMTLRNSGMPAGFSKILSPFMAAMMRRANNKDLRSIRKIIENRQQRAVDAN
jgi:uncharacterized membrane protein